jgi:membrane protease YdiL (CAAX protease family)
MSPMNHAPRGFQAAVLAGWTVLAAAGWQYARVKGIPGWAAVPMVAAFLLEYLFYLVAAVESVRERLAGPLLPWLMIASALAPYLAYSIATGQFHWAAFARLAVFAVTISLWYAVLPPAPVVDVCFVLLLALVYLRHFFDPIYLAPLPRLDLPVLGKLALIHLAAIALLVQRRVPHIGFGLLPTRREWAIGVRQYLWFLPLGLGIAWALKFPRLASPAPVWQIGLTFLGALWVIALSEEFFFRGLLQQWLTKWTGSAAAGLAAASVLFGLAHLGFRFFPNWGQVLVAAVLGWFCGGAYVEAGTIRAGMVTHALAVASWRALFA